MATIDSIREVMTWAQRHDYLPLIEVPNKISQNDEYASWNNALLSAYENMGHHKRMSLKEFAATKRQYVYVPWQIEACNFVYERPETAIAFSGKRYCWTFRRRGEWVAIELPYHDAGGEKYWISQFPFKVRYLADID